jgi:orotate phosphoribosyltransferase
LPRAKAGASFRAVAAEDRAELLTLLRRLSVRFGEFTLASGRTSDFYVDVKQTVLLPRGAELLGDALLEALRSRAAAPRAVAGVELGGVPLCTAVSLASARDGGLPLPALVVRKQPKGHGTSSAVEGMGNVPAGADVVVVEDTVTSGGSGVKALGHLREAGLNPVLVVAVVDRGEGGARAFEAAGVPYLPLFRRADLEQST